MRTTSIAQGAGILDSKFPIKKSYVRSAGFLCHNYNVTYSVDGVANLILKLCISLILSYSRTCSLDRNIDQSLMFCFRYLSIHLAHGSLWNSKTMVPS